MRAEIDLYIDAFHVWSGFFEEKATLFGRIGRHDQALAIYVTDLKSPRMAEDYCLRTYEKDKENAKDVYLSLLKVR